VILVSVPLIFIVLIFGGRLEDAFHHILQRNGRDAKD